MFERSDCEVILINTSNSSRRTSDMISATRRWRESKSHGISNLSFHSILMQRLLLSSCTRSRSLTYAPPFSFLMAARFNSSPRRVLPQQLNDMVINTAERASTLAVSSAEVIWSDRSKRVMEEVARSPPANAYSG